jgi:hypothetical protein
VDLASLDDLELDNHGEWLGLQNLVLAWVAQNYSFEHD